MSSVAAVITFSNAAILWVRYQCILQITCQCSHSDGQVSVQSFCRSGVSAVVLQVRCQCSRSAGQVSVQSFCRSGVSAVVLQVRCQCSHSAGQVSVQSFCRSGVSAVVLQVRCQCSRSAGHMSVHIYIYIPMTSLLRMRRTGTELVVPSYVCCHYL